MRRIIRRTDTVVTIQTWTVTWAEDVPAGEPTPATPPPARLPEPAPDKDSSTPAANPTAPEPPPALPDSD